MDFLAERKGLPCRISGKAATGESSSTMGDYRARLLDLRDGMDKPPKNSPGTFFLDTANGQSNVSTCIVGCDYYLRCELGGGVGLWLGSSETREVRLVHRSMFMFMFGVG